MISIQQILLIPFYGSSTEILAWIGSYAEGA